MVFPGQPGQQPLPTASADANRRLRLCNHSKLRRRWLLNRLNPSCSLNSPLKRRSLSRAGPVLQPQHTAQTMQPQYTAQTLRPQQDVPTMQQPSQPPSAGQPFLMPQTTGFQPPAPQSHGTIPSMMMPGLDKPMTPPHLVGVPAAAIILAQQGGMQPQWQPQQMQMQNGYPAASRSVPHQSKPLPRSIDDPSSNSYQRSRSQSQSQRNFPPQGKPTRASTGIQAEPVARPHPAESYLDRADYDPRLRSMLDGAQKQDDTYIRVPSL